MAVSSILDLLAALEAADLAQIIGTPEGHELDFKSSPYRLDAAKGKWELAKDVAGLANASGGCIVIGPQTEQHPHEVVETVTSVSQVPKELVSVSQYRDILGSWVYPPVQGVEFRWYPSTGDRGILVIRVPPAADQDRPLLVRRVVIVDGDEIAGIAIPRRSQDRTEWEPAERIHQSIKTGRMRDHAATEAKRQADRERTGRTAGERAKDLRAFAGWPNAPSLILQAKAPDATDLLGHLHGEAGIAGDARRWKGIRRSGFDLVTSAEPQSLGDLIALGSTRWKAVIDASGWFEFVLPADWDFLGWGMRRDRADPPPHVRINAVALVEVVHDFFRFMKSVLAPRSAAGSWHAWVRGLGMQSGGVELHHGFARGIDWDEPRTATTDIWVKDFESSGDPGVDAFHALVRIYALWGIGPDGIPFTRDGRVDPQQIIGLRG